MQIVILAKKGEKGRSLSFQQQEENGPHRLASYEIDTGQTDGDGSNLGVRAFNR